MATMLYGGSRESNMGRLDLSSICDAVVHCGACRDREGGRAWRESLAKAFAVPAGWPDCECPLGRPWGYIPPPMEQTQQNDQLRPPPSTDVNVISVMTQDRLAECSRCEAFTETSESQWHRKQDPNAEPQKTCLLVPAACKFRSLLLDPRADCPHKEPRWRAMETGVADHG
jgi:hypothetical protein